MDLAEKIIENQGKSDGDMYVDDLGFLVETDIANDPAKLCNYLLVRVLKKHGRPYRENGVMYIDGIHIGYGRTPDKMFPTTILRLIDSPLPAKVSNMQIMWMYNRLFDISTRLNNNIIQVSRDLVFNLETSEFERKEDE